MPATTAAVNGHGAQNGVTGTHKPGDIPVTSIFSNFVANASTEDLTPHIRGRLKEYIIDFIGVTLAASHASESTVPFCNAVKALGGQNNGSCTVLGKGKSYTPQYAGLLNATLGHSLDFDDTYAKGTLHAGVTAIGAGLTQAELLGDQASMDRFLLAVAVGYEITCRLGKELGNDAYSRGFHNTSTAGIFGAVATIAVLKGLSVEIVENAFGLAGSKAAGSMQYLENGSWNKRLHPGFAVHDAFICVALAEAGVVGAAKIFEGTFGFLHAYSPKPDKDLTYLTADLGKRWEFLETSLKPFPACRMTHGFIEHAVRLGRDKGFSKAQDVKSITLALSPANVSVVGAPIPNKIHPENMVDAQFSAYFTTANSFLYGSDNGVRCYEKDRLMDPQIRELTDKIRCVGDSSIKEFGSKMKVEYANGEVSEIDIPYPLGELQHPFTREQVDAKFFSLVNPIYGEKKAMSIRDAVDNIEKHTVSELLAMC
ncbi:uncharacterized protein Z520_03180 [Fonsecaea multimorphosa CBS 102226]|uniref:MmgE/PrpD family protein n=1 Tax=Fonsecaea multimorphosa CBS 102226 TaxID=1442371 RepID=A0A0D2K6U7_9EURO|nr:uncharacterized protein Z520_03180 [Fonsecaea multimorphosa CBS 102226]KIY01628.1 hypothetical protein Z520_03180 [Fonsecaea multimorphosa CBS 102226]OAL23101.1 hypothetical protein AYO22_06594 [Fonsecaea multimorphosa]